MRASPIWLAIAACAAESGPELETPPVVERELVASDGSREFPVGWWDTRHQVACGFVRGADGAYRCLPGVVTSYEVSSRADCAEPFRAVIYEPEGLFRTADDVTGDIAAGVYEIDIRFESDELFRVFPLAGCVPFFTAGWSIAEVQPDPPLVEVSRYSESAFVATAGERLEAVEPGDRPPGWYDPELETACRFASIGDEVRCFPTGLERVESINLFADASCDRTDAEVLPATTSRFVLTTAPVLRVLEVDGRYDGPLFMLTGDGCVEAAGSDDVVLAHPAHDSFVRGLLVPGPGLDF